MVRQETCVLLVEDEPGLRRLLHLALRREGWDVLEAGDGAAALRIAEERHLDVVILDLMLPDIDGFEVCRRLRARSALPIIILSAKDNSHDVVAGLEAGADDYVVKPAVAHELSARIRAVLRRGHSASTTLAETWRSDALEMRLAQNLLIRDGREIRLTATESRILQHLAGQADEVIPRRVLLEGVWGPGYADEDRLLDVQISRLRGKLEEDPRNPRHLVTVRGVGYLLRS